MHAFLKYGAISLSIFLVALGIRYIPYIPHIGDLLPLSPEAFDRLGQAPTKDLSDGLTGESFTVRIFEKMDLAGLSDSPSKEPEGDYGVLPLPVPRPELAPIPTEPPPIGLPTPEQIVKVVERIVERVVIREVPVPVPTPTPPPAGGPTPAPAASIAAETACSINTFENFAGGSSHTLIYQCEGFDQCSIDKNGENFVDVNGKGYFNFAGGLPASYKIRCDDKARVWSSSITPSATKPLFTQLAFRWFNNVDRDMVGTPIAQANQPVAYKNISKTGQLRLRLVVLAERAQVLRGEAKFKLQGAVAKPAVPISSALSNYGDFCNQIPDSEFKDLTAFDNLTFFNNPSVEDKSLLAANIEDPFYGFAIPQTYQESNVISNTNAAIPLNNPAIWDISFRLREVLSNELICLRLVRQDNVLLDGYENWPAIYNN